MVLLQIVTASVLLVGSGKFGNTEGFVKAAESASVAETLEKSAAAGNLLELSQQVAVLKYCVGLRRDIEQRRSEVGEISQIFKASLFWTSILLFACGIATAAFLFVQSKKSRVTQIS